MCCAILFSFARSQAPSRQKSHLCFLFLFFSPPKRPATPQTPMVSVQEIASCVESLIRQAGPTAGAGAAFVPAVVRQLESQLGLDLSHKTPSFATRSTSSSPPQNPQFSPQHFQLQRRQLSHHSSSPFTHLPSHHELSFQYPAAGGSGVQCDLGQQQLQHLPQALTLTAQKESAPKRRGGSGGLSKVCGVSPELQVIVGEPTMARTQIVKQLWAYIRENNLQDPNNKRKIICNEELRRVFETDCTDMFKMNKLLAKHIITLDSSKDSNPEVKRIKATPTEEVPTTESKLEQYTVVISDALAKFFGMDEKEMLQSEASQRVWEYIKTNHLEDPVNTMSILCDSKLKELFGCESLSAFGVSQLLSRHMLKKS